MGVQESLAPPATTPSANPLKPQTHAIVHFRKPLEKAANQRGEKHKKDFARSESRKGTEPGVSG